jgi:hypothetical protein
LPPASAAESPHPATSPCRKPSPAHKPPAAGLVSKTASPTSPAFYAPRSSAELTGFVVEKTGSLLVPFVITAALCMVGGLAWFLVVGKVEEVQWKSVKATSG